MDEKSEELSPDGMVLVRWSLDHGLGNIAYRVPAIHDARSGALLFDLGGRFDGSVTWLEDGRFRLHLGRWWQGGRAEFLVDPAAGTYRVAARPEEGETEDGPEEPLETLPDRAEYELERGKEERERLGAAMRADFQREMFWKHDLPRAFGIFAAALGLVAIVSVAGLWWRGQLP